MLRFYYVIVLRIFSIMYFVPKMAYYARHPEKYSEEDCYALAQNVVGKVIKTARVTTEYYGTENLPAENGYLMFANHQGKYDALGVFAGHEKPCSVLMDKERSEMFIAKQFVDLLKGQRIEKSKPKQQVSVLKRIAEEVREGRNYLIFPEGGYEKKKDNSLEEFKYGCFHSAMKAKCPVVPVALLDSYKPFGKNSLRRVYTKVVYLPPVEYEFYKDMSAEELCGYVKEQIKKVIDRYEALQGTSDNKRTA